MKKRKASELGKMEWVPCEMWQCRLLYFLTPIPRHRGAEVTQAGALKGLRGRVMGKAKEKGQLLVQTPAPLATGSPRQVLEWKQSGSVYSRERFRIAHRRPCAGSLHPKSHTS